MSETSRTQSQFGERISALPSGPGVYIFRNDRDQVIYVGKAANLRNRVRSYFGSPRSMEPKTSALVQQIADFEYIVTPSV
ncbi:MAG TPA: GIY-YIG nuclease family protein, partial [Dehalococcoidia bacterium]|nr:GIY-YIG nuclease family protein [Dehalococcoidia bacterium]